MNRIILAVVAAKFTSFVLKIAAKLHLFFHIGGGFIFLHIFFYIIIYKNNFNHNWKTYIRKLIASKMSRSIISTYSAASMVDDMQSVADDSSASFSIKDSDAKVSMLHRSAEKRGGLSKVKSRYQVRPKWLIFSKKTVVDIECYLTRVSKLMNKCLKSKHLKECKMD
jgi:hypothetical protein